MVLQVNFLMTCIIHKILVLLKTTIILKRVLRSIINFYSLKDNYFSQHIMMESPNLEETKHDQRFKDTKHLFRLEKLKKKKKLILQLKYKKSR